MYGGPAWVPASAGQSPLAHLERFDETGEALKALVKEKPDMAVCFVAETLPFRREADRLLFEDGLRRAGLER